MDTPRTPHTPHPDDRVLAEIAEAHHREFVAYAQRLGAAEPEETVQDAYCRMVPHVARFHAEDARRFLYTVIRNLTIDQHRRSCRIRMTPVPELPHVPSYERDMETDLLVRDYMDRAPGREGVVLDMIGDGYNDSEIARQLTVTRDHVRRIKGAARAQLSASVGHTSRGAVYFSFD